MFVRGVLYAGLPKEHDKYKKLIIDNKLKSYQTLLVNLNHMELIKTNGDLNEIIYCQ